MRPAALAMLGLVDTSPDGGQQRASTSPVSGIDGPLDGATLGFSWLGHGSRIAHKVGWTSL
jgi:hypothetical protein